MPQVEAVAADVGSLICKVEKFPVMTACCKPAGHHPAAVVCRELIAAGQSAAPEPCSKPPPWQHTAWGQQRWGPPGLGSHHSPNGWPGFVRHHPVQCERHIPGWECPNRCLRAAGRGLMSHARWANAWQLLKHRFTQVSLKFTFGFIHAYGWLKQAACSTYTEWIALMTLSAELVWKTLLSCWLQTERAAPSAGKSMLSWTEMPGVYSLQRYGRAVT